MNREKIYRIAFIIFILSPHYCLSQKLEIVDFYEDVGRLDAVREPVKDLNGTPCGLIRLGLVHSSVEFEGDIMKSEYRNCEWYIWMAEGAKYIVIKATGFLPLPYDFDEPIKSKTTYIMTVIKPEIVLERNKFRLFIPFAFPIGKLGKGSENWTSGGNAWSNYPFDLSYFFENNSGLSKAARNIGFGLGTKAIIPLKKSTTALMVKAEYLLMSSNSSKHGTGQTIPAEILYYQYNPNSGLNTIKVLATEMDMTFPRLNTMDVMLGVNKKFRNIIGSSHLELEGAIGTAWHWNSDFVGESSTSGEYKFVANYDIFSKRPSLAFEVGLTLTLGDHLSIGLNYVNLGNFDVKGHASWSSTVIPTNDANINNVDFNFGHVTVHYLGLVLGYSVQHR